MSEHRLRALVLAVLMVTSVVAGSGLAVGAESTGDRTLIVDTAGNAAQPGVYTDLGNALADATTDDTVEVRSGTYDLGSGVAVPKDTTGVSIVGAGQGATTLDAADASCWGLKVSAGAHDTTLEGFTLEGPSSASYYCTGLKANFVQNLTVSDVTVQHSNWGEIDLNNVRNTTLTDVTAVGGDDAYDSGGVGVAVTASEDVTLDDVDTRGNSWGGIGLFTDQPSSVPSDWSVVQEPDDVTITGHSSTSEPVPIYAQNDTSAGLGYGDLTLDGYEYTVGNPNHKSDSAPGEFTFFHQTRDAAVAYAVSDYQYDTSTAYVNPLTTADDGTTVADGDTYVVGSADGTASTSMSLGTALSRADANDTISVGDGVYEPFIVRTAGLTVEAADGQSPTVESSGDGIGIRANEVTIRGLHVTGAGDGTGVGIRASGPGEGGPAKNVTVAGTTVEQFLTGIQIAPKAATPDAPARVTNNTVAGTSVGVSVGGNTTVSDNYLVVAGDGEGIGVGDTVGTDVIRNNQIVLTGQPGVGYTPDPARGVALYAGSGDVIEQNSVTGGDTGVWVADAVGSVNGETGDVARANALLADNTVANVTVGGGSYDGSVTVDGTAYPNISTAVDAADPGDTVELAPGTYDEQVEIGKNLTLAGAGPNETTITTDSGPAVLVAGHTPDAGDAVGSVTLTGFTAVAGSGGSGIATYSETSQNDYDTKSLTVENVHVDGSAGYGVTLTSTAEATLSDVSITGVGSDTVGAVEAVGVGDLTITDSTVGDNGVGVNVLTADGYGAVDSVSITGTTFSGNAIHVRDTTGAVDTDAVVVNNDLAGAVTASPTAGETAIWASIQPAIDAAESGTTVQIGPGTYNESLDVRKDLTLAGSGETETIVEAGSVDDYGLSTTANVTLRDFTLGGPTVDAAYAYGIKAQFASLPDGNYARTDVTIEDVTVRNSDKTEIDLNGVGSAHLVDVTADGNGTGGAGIALSDTRDVTIENATTTGNGWGAVAVYTNGGYAVPAGTDGVTFAGDNSFENSVYLQGDLSLITNVEVPADATHEVTAEQGGYVGYFDSQADAEAFVAATDSPDAFLIRSLADGEDGDTYTVAENQSVADTVSQVPAGSTVVVNKSSIDSSVSISKSITLVAGEISSGSGSISADATSATSATSRPTITSTLAIDNYADDVTIEGFAVDLDAGGRIDANGAGDDLTIRNNVFTGGSSDSGVVAAVSHGGSSTGQGTAGARTGWLVADNEFRDIDGQALRLWNLQSLTVEDNAFSNLTYSAVSHLGVADTTIRNNSFTDIGRSGVYVDAGSFASSLGVQGVTVENNSFENVGAPDGQYDQGGVNVGANVGDLSEITVRANDFFGGQYGIHVANESQDATGTIDAGLNYWNASSGPSGLGDGTGVPITAGVQYSPVLPNETSTYDDVTDVGSGTYDVVVPADGESRVVAFPMDVNGTVGDVFGNFDGNLWAWNATSDSWDRVEDSSREVDALDAFVVSLDENASDLRVTFTVAPAVGDEPGVPPEADLDAGWNLVGAPQFGEAGSAFGASTADPARVLKTYRGPTGEPFAPGFESATGVVGDTDAVSPFEGYWVYATQDGTLAGNVPPGTDATELDDLLKEA